MNRLRRFMYGRYGFDQFSQFIIGLSLIVTLVGSITRNQFIILFSYLILIYAIFRMVSKNINKRRQENYKYIQFINPIKRFLNQAILMLKGTKTHKYYKCPKCKQTIRVPRGKGKICISCPKCRAEFTKRT